MFNNPKSYSTLHYIIGYYNFERIRQYYVFLILNRSYMYNKKFNNQPYASTTTSTSFIRMWTTSDKKKSHQEIWIKKEQAQHQKRKLEHEQHCQQSTTFYWYLNNNLENTNFNSKHCKNNQQARGWNDRESKRNCFIPTKRTRLEHE